MNKIGNVVSPEKLINHKEVPFLNYYKDVSEVGNQLPTLIIGWNYFKSTNIGGEADILTKNMVNQRYWEFSPDEDIVQYSQGLENFVKRIPEYYISKYRYVNIDPFFQNLYTVEQLQNFFKPNGDLYVYKKDILYYRKGYVICGLKLSIYEYLGHHVDDIINVMVSKSKNHLLDDSTEYQKFYKLFPEFGLLKRSMVVFLFS